MNRIDEEEFIANTFSRAYSETRSIADAFRVTEEIVRRRRAIDVGAFGLNALISEVSAARSVPEKSILGRSKDRLVCAARDEVWWRARERQTPLSYEALGAAFGRHHTAIIDGVRRHEARLGASTAVARAASAWGTAA
jgi:chromosomal replication initiation ATPase DnaA